MVAVIEGLLSKEQVQTIAKRLFGAQFTDGTMSGGPLGKEIKKNTQVAPNSPEYRELADFVLSILRQNDEIAVTALPKRILPPIFASYTEGHRYGDHVDAALMGPYPGMRTDLSITIFLNDPGAYEGGELVLQTDFGEQIYKRSAGDAVLYPTHYRHRVNPVTRGRRMAIVTWMESMVRDPAKREIIKDLAEVMDLLVSKKGDDDLIRRVEKSRLNLLRMWADA